MLLMLEEESLGRWCADTGLGRGTEAEACLVPLVCVILSRCQGQDGNSDRLYKKHHLLLVEGSNLDWALWHTGELLLPPSVLLPPPLLLIQLKEQLCTCDPPIIRD